jgi:hypothetical protein
MYKKLNYLQFIKFNNKLSLFYYELQITILIIINEKLKNYVFGLIKWKKNN